MRALVVIAQGIEELETVTVTDLLVRGGISITLASVNERQVTAARGLTLTTDVLLKDVQDDFDIVICPGGLKGAEQLAASDILTQLLLARHHKRQLLAAICAAPALVFEKIGLLDGRSATCFPALSSHLVDYRDQAVVTDGHIITSQGPATAPMFALSIIKKLVGDVVAHQVAKDALYKDWIG